MVPQADPMVHRHQAWGGTHGNGAHPSYGGWGGAQADQTPYGGTIAIAGKPYESGIGILANSRLEVRNDGAATFTAEVGVDDSSVDRSPVNFAVYGDGKLLFTTPAKAYRDKAETIRVPVKGVKIIELVATTAQTTHPTVVAWGNAALLN